MIVPQQVSQVDDLLKSAIRNAGLRLTYNVSSGAQDLRVMFTGLDVPHLLARNAELLLALEHLATQVIRLEPSQHELVSFDAGGFKEQRERALSRLAQQGLDAVLATGKPHAFRPMNSRERRLLHLALADSGHKTESEGEGSMRHLVVHPRGSF